MQQTYYRRLNHTTIRKTPNRSINVLKKNWMVILNYWKTAKQIEAGLSLNYRPERAENTPDLPFFYFNLSQFSKIFP